MEITEDAIVEAVKLADRYITDRFLPDKAIDLIDETGSRAKLQTYALPSELKALEQELKKISREKELAISMQNFEEAVRHREEEERLRKLLDESKREWKKNQEKHKPTIGKEEVAYVVSKMTGIPLFKLEEEESNKLLRMEEFLHKRVIGQNEAISAVARAIRAIQGRAQGSKKPIGSFIFLGPTGVGKRSWRERSQNSSSTVRTRSSESTCRSTRKSSPVRDCSELRLDTWVTKKVDN